MAEADTSTLIGEVQERYRLAGRRLGKARPRRPTKPCQYDGCTRWAWARGYCGSHYQRMREEGKLPRVRDTIGAPVARFHASYIVNLESGCWEWTGWIHPKNYPILVIGGKAKQVRGHRFSYELHKSPIPQGLLVCHRCDNRRCVNPDHLFLGDDVDNMRDMVSKGRHGAQTWAIRPKITRAMALNIRVMYARGEHSMVKLAGIYGVDHSTVSGIIKGRSHLFVGR